MKRISLLVAFFGLVTLPAYAGPPADRVALESALNTFFRQAVIVEGEVGYFAHLDFCNGTRDACSVFLADQKGDAEQMLAAIRAGQVDYQNLALSEDLKAGLLIAHRR